MDSSNVEFGVSWVFRKTGSVLCQNCGRLILLAILLNVTIWQFLEDFPDYVYYRFPAWEESGMLGTIWEVYLPLIEATVFSVAMTATFTYVVYVYLTRDTESRLQDQVTHVKSLGFASTVWRTFIATSLFNVISALLILAPIIMVSFWLAPKLDNIGTLTVMFAIVGVQMFNTLLVCVLMSRCLLIIPAVVGDRLNIRRSFRQSWDLTSNYRLQIWLIYTLFSLALGLLTLPLLAVQFITDLKPLFHNSQLVDSFEKLRPFNPLLSIAYTVIYAAFSSVLSTVCYVHLKEQNPSNAG